MPYINGQTVTLDEKAQTMVLNPADGKPVAKVSMSSPAQMRPRPPAPHGETHRLLPGKSF